MVARGPSKRVLRRNAKAALNNAIKLSKRGRKKISPTERAACEHAIAQLRVVLASGDAAENALQTAIDDLHRASHEHLARFRKPAWREFFESIASALLIALAIRAFLFEAFRIPSGSMIPTLAIGDQIFVNKMLYGPRIPFSTHRILEGKPPKRGEVVVFVYPVAKDQDFIKRIVALAGDTLQVKNGVITLNGSPVAQRPLGPRTFSDRMGDGGPWSTFTALVSEETLDGHTYHILQDPRPEYRLPDFGPVTVPEGHVFAMGDNRDHSSDSRIWGPVPLGHIVGRATFVWWSWGPEGLRLARLGEMVK